MAMCTVALLLRALCLAAAVLCVRGALDGATTSPHHRTLRHTDGNARAASSGVSGFEQSLAPARAQNFSLAQAKDFPAVDAWFFVVGVTANGVRFVYLNALGRDHGSEHFSATGGPYGSPRTDSVCDIGVPLGRFFTGSLNATQHAAGVSYTADVESGAAGDGTFFTIQDREDPRAANERAAGRARANESGAGGWFPSSLAITLNDTVARIQSSVAAFGPQFMFSYEDARRRAHYLQVQGRAIGVLKGVAFAGWGGIEYHRGYNTWGQAPPFADLWYEQWLLGATWSPPSKRTPSSPPRSPGTPLVSSPLVSSPSHTDAVSSYSLAIVGSAASGFSGGYRGKGAYAELIAQPAVTQWDNVTCTSGSSLPASITVAPLQQFTADTRIIANPGFSWLARIQPDHFGWWETHTAQ